MNAAEGIEIAELGWSIVSKVYEVVEAHKSGKLSTEDARARLATLDAELAANNAAADKIVHDRFHPTDEKP